MNPFMNQYAGNFQPNMYQQFQSMYNNMNPNNQNGMCFNPYMYQHFMNQQNMNMNMNMNPLMNNNNMNMDQLFQQFLNWMNMNGYNNQNMNVCNNANMNGNNNQNMNNSNNNLNINNNNLNINNNNLPNKNNNNQINNFNNTNVGNSNNNVNLSGGNSTGTKETLPRGDKLVEYKNEYPDEEMENMKNIIFLATSGYRVAIVAPFYETISNILKLFARKIGIGENTLGKEIFFIFDATYLDKDDQRALNELCFAQNITITVIDGGNVLGA